MEIKYLGHASFLIKSKDTKLVTDPFDSYIGMKFPKVEADIITVSHHHKDHDNIGAVQSPPSRLQPPLVIDMPGEFEKMGIRIIGTSSFHDKSNGAERGENILYKIEAEGMSVLHCGDLGLVPDEPFLDAIGDVDVLLVPVGGFYTIDATEAAELVKKIEPSIVVPMHYSNPRLDQKIFGKLTTLNEFLKKFGVENIAPIIKLVVKREELEQEMKIIPMEISG